MNDVRVGVPVIGAHEEVEHDLCCVLHIQLGDGVLQPPRRAWGGDGVPVKSGIYHSDGGGDVVPVKSGIYHSDGGGDVVPVKSGIYHSDVEMELEMLNTAFICQLQDNRSGLFHSHHS